MKKAGKTTMSYGNVMEIFGKEMNSSSDDDGVIFVASCRKDNMNDNGKMDCPSNALTVSHSPTLEGNPQTFSTSPAVSTGQAMAPPRGVKSSSSSQSTLSNFTMEMGQVFSKPWGKLVKAGESTNNDTKEFQLCETHVLIGRAATSNVRVVALEIAKHVSRNHASITKVNDYTFYLTDLGSMNGTLLNGKRIFGKELLKHGDIITISGGLKVQVGEYLVLDNGKKRSDFTTIQEWKYEMAIQMPKAFMYRFELLQGQFIGLNLNPPKNSLIQFPGEKSYPIKKEETSSSEIVEQITLTGKREREEEVEQNENKKMKDSTLSVFSEEILGHLNCSICYNYYVEPTLIECGHTFCRKCLHEWLVKNRSCPLCRKKLCRSSTPNRSVDAVLKVFVERFISEDEKKIREERIKAIETKDVEDFVKFRKLSESARDKKIKFLDIHQKWKIVEKKTFKNGIGQYMGKCRAEYCNLVGITESFVHNCTTEELIIACDNIEIPVAYLIVGQVIDQMRRVIDLDQTRQRLVTFWEATDNLFSI